MLDNSDAASLSSSLDDSGGGGGADGMIVDIREASSPCPSTVSSVSSSMRIERDQSLCQLSWRDHQMHLMDYFESLYQRESMVDVTLVCPELSIRAHRVVLSACSGYLGAMLADNPCSHPVVILDEARGWQLQALVRFMYRGEIVNVTREDLPSLIQLAETLKVRGLTTLESVEKSSSGIIMSNTTDHSLPSANKTIDSSNSIYLKQDLYDEADDHCLSLAKLARYASPFNGYSFDGHHSSPLPRRKQARPRRRSGDSSTTTTPPSMVIDPPFKPFMLTPSPIQDAPEDLSVKKSPVQLMMMRQESEDTNLDSSLLSREDTPLPVPSLKADSVNSDSAKSEFSLAERNSLFSPGPSVSSLMMSTPPSSNSFPSLTPIHQSDRRKGQHSAPRGGPPRAWTNGDLTDALNHVWNRKMTTSQASRVFGIPYNSLLMYVRGKYGKSLKLDTLRKDTLEGEAMALAASTRGSYKLAAAAAAAAAAATSGNGNASSSSSKSSNTNSTTTTKATKTNANNNNNSNHKNNNETKISTKNSPPPPPPPPLSSTAPSTPSGPLNLNPYAPHRLNDMEALSMAGLAAGLGGFNGMVNPYLSYFCDFSFPVPGLMPPNGPSLGSKHIRPIEKRSSDLHRPLSSNEKIGSKHRVKDVKGHLQEHHSNMEVDAKTDDEEGASPLPLRLGRSLIQSPLVDMTAQPGQV